MCASKSHSYTHLILALGIVREPTVWVFITSKYLGTHDIGLPNKSNNTSNPGEDASHTKCAPPPLVPPQRSSSGVLLPGGVLLGGGTQLSIAVYSCYVSVTPDVAVM